jgi:trehalose/maltose transport system substrate-binding protein
MRISVLVSTLLLSSVTWATESTLTVYCFNKNHMAPQCRKMVSAWAKENNVKITIKDAPHTTTEALRLYQKLLSGKGGEIDVFPLDMVFAGTLAADLLDLKTHFDQKFYSRLPQSLLRNNIIDGRLVAVPWYIDIGVLFYRTDLLAKYGLEPPKTFAEFRNAAQTVQQGERKAGRKSFYGYLFQGDAYEGLTCNVLEWLSGNQAAYISDSGPLALTSPKVIETVETIGPLAHEMSPTAVTSFDEKKSRELFLKGDAAFLRLWASSYTFLNGKDSSLKGKVGMVPIPPMKMGSSASGMLGGYSLAVAKNTKHAEQAISLVKYLSSDEQQLTWASTTDAIPPSQDLLNDPRSGVVHSQARLVSFAISTSSIRPSSTLRESYPMFSDKLARAVHEALKSPQKTSVLLRGAQDELGKLKAR